jgi:ribosomal protein S12 methylthiotransferase accessory factor YcaO
MGIPCCKCFVIRPKGGIVKGTGAHLTARKALISAMTETPYPFPFCDPSGPGLDRPIRVPVENLPDYCLGNGAENLRLLETLLIANGYHPIYADLTRKDLNIPVVRALIPGMDISGDFGPFSRVHPSLYYNYMKMFKITGNNG